MTRNDFLKQLGLGAAFVLTSSCLHGCSKDDENADVPTAPDANLRIDLTEAGAEELLVDGGYIIREKVVIARTIDGKFAAATLICSHAGNENVLYNKTADEWQCTVHGARYEVASGDGLNDFGSKGLRIYTVTQVDENTLVVS